MSTEVVSPETSPLPMSSHGLPLFYVLCSKHLFL